MSMFCPACGQERISEETIYCSRCGYLLTGTADLMAIGGVIPTAAPTKGFRSPTPRNRGLKQGLFIFLLTFLIVPLISILTIAVHAPPFGVAIAAILFSVGGLLRMSYAMMFESNETSPLAVSGASSIPRSVAGPAPGLGLPAPAYRSPGDIPRGAGSWRDTNDLQPVSVTDNTTQLLEHTEQDQ